MNWPIVLRLIRLRRSIMLSTLVALGCVSGAVWSRGTSNVGAELSPGVAWEPHGPHTRAVGPRRLNAAEVKLAQQRAAGFYAAFIAGPGFRTPRERAHLVTSAASIDRSMEGNRNVAPTLRQDINDYWTVPRDANWISGSSSRAPAPRNASVPPGPLKYAANSPRHLIA